MIFNSPHPPKTFATNVSLTHLIFSEDQFEKNAKSLGVGINEFKQKPALISPSRDVSMRILILQAIENLKDNGVKKGDIISVVSRNALEFPVLFYAALVYGCILAPLNPVYIAPELLHHVEDSQSRFIIANEEFLEKAFGVVDAFRKKHPEGRKVSVLCLGNLEKRTGSTLYQRPFAYNQTEVPNIVTDVRKELDQNVNFTPENFPLACDFEKDFGLLVYSSGTTGLPKGVCLSHSNMTSNLIQMDDLHNEPPQPENILSILPMFHVYGQLIIHRNLVSGNTTVVQEVFEAQSFIENLQRYDITIAPIVPPILILLAKSPTVNSQNLKLKHIGCGAAPSGEEIIQQLREKLPEVTISQGYGLSESSGVVSTSSRKWEINQKSSGQLLPNTHAKIVDPQTGKLLGPGEKGEIWVKGPQIFLKYLNNEKATQETIDHEGDIGYIDKDNYIFVVDRIKELIKFSGFQVAPAELEAILLSHPEVADCAVYRAPDDQHGEIPAAVVVKKDKDSATSEQEIMNWFSKQVTYFKAIRKLEFVDQVPKSQSGKILRRDLVEKAFSKSKL